MPLPNPPVDVDTLLATTPATTIRSTIVSSLVTMKIRADLWPTSGVASSVLTDVSEAIGAAYSSVQSAIAAGWLPTATGGWLTWIAFYFYGITRIPASFASGNETLTNTGAVPYNYDPGQVTFQNAVTKQTFTNIDPIALAPGTSQTIVIECVNAGSVGNSAPGEISTLVTTMLGVTVTNPTAVLGNDAQLDDDLRQMCWNSLGARSVRGPRTAYAFAIQIATNPVTGTPVNINRFTITSSSHKGQVAIVVASPSGAPTSDDVTGVATSIEAVARPECVIVTVTGATAVPYAGSVVVYMAPQPGLSQATVATAVAAALDTFFKSPLTNPIGGLTADGFTGLHQSGVEGAAQAAYPGIFAVDASGFDPTTNDTLVLTPGQVVVNASSVSVRFTST